MSCGGSGRWCSIEPSSAREIGRRVVDHDDRGEGSRAHAAAALASTARVSRAARSQERSATCCAPASARRVRRAGSPASSSSASASAPASPGTHVARALSEDLAQRRDVGHDRRRAAHQPLERREAEALEVRRKDDRERAGLEAVELGVGDASERADVRLPAMSGASRPSPATTSSASSPRARAVSYASREHVDALARLERARIEEVAAGRRREAAADGAPRAGTHDPHPAGVERPARRGLLRGGARDRDDPRSTPRQSRGLGKPVPRPLVHGEVGGALLPGKVVHRQGEREVGTERERRGGRSPHDVHARAKESLEPGEAGERARAVEQAPGQSVADHPHARSGERVGERRRPAAGHQHAPLVVGELLRERAHQRARIVRDPPAPPTGEAPTIDPDLHAP